MKVLGLDLGNYATKTSEGVVFNSRTEDGHKELNKNDIKVEYLGNKYTVGTGNLNLGKTRTKENAYKICMLTAIAKSYPGEQNIEVNLVVGLPPAQFEGPLRAELQDQLNKLGTERIMVDGLTVSITINKAIVFSESAIVFSSPIEYRDKKVLVVDIGGGTADISQFKGLQLVHSTTEKMGMLTLCENMKNTFNTKERTMYSADDMEELINKDTTIIRGEKKDITYLKSVIDSYVGGICNIITQNFNDESTEIKLIGGGVEKLKEYFKKRYENIDVVENSQFANANTYATIGRKIYER